VVSIGVSSASVKLTSAYARGAVLAILRQHGLSTADAGAIVDEDDRAALGAFLSGRTDDIDMIRSKIWRMCLA
jgi:hypothetical protein